MYRELRRAVAGSQDAKHSLNQRRLKRIVHMQRRFGNQFGLPEERVVPARPNDAMVLVPYPELQRLMALGIFGKGPEGELEAAVHCVGSELNRIQPLQCA